MRHPQMHRSRFRLPHLLAIRPQQQMARVWALALVWALAACGGGGDSAGPGETASASYTTGSIRGLASVIVGSTRYDDDSATIHDDDDNPASRDALQIGMVVEVEGSPLRAAPSGRSYEREGEARAIRFAAVIVGPVEAVDAAAGQRQLAVFGQQVSIDRRTVFGPSLRGGLDAIAAGDVLRIHGFISPDRHTRTGLYTATRIDREGHAAHFRLHGVVDGFDPAAHLFRIGTTTLDFLDVGREVERLNVRDGRIVRVRTDTVPDLAGAYRIDRLQAMHQRPRSRDEVEIEGYVTRFFNRFDFDVEGLPVDASRARFDDDDGDLALGAWVEVEGYLRDGLLVAREVEVDDDDDDRERPEITLSGRIQSLDPFNRVFVLRGLLVDYSGRVDFDNGRESDLANGVKVEVDGVLAPGGWMVIAHEIDIDD